jgi:hypothetical protein
MEAMLSSGEIVFKWRNCCRVERILLSRENVVEWRECWQLESVEGAGRDGIPLSAGCRHGKGMSSGSMFVRNCDGMDCHGRRIVGGNFTQLHGRTLMTNQGIRIDENRGQQTRLYDYQPIIGEGISWNQGAEPKTLGFPNLHAHRSKLNANCSQKPQWPYHPSVQILRSKHRHIPLLASTIARKSDVPTIFAFKRFLHTIAKIHNNAYNHTGQGIRIHTCSLDIWRHKNVCGEPFHQYEQAGQASLVKIEHQLKEPAITTFLALFTRSNIVTIILPVPLHLPTTLFEKRSSKSRELLLSAFVHR